MTGIPSGRSKAVPFIPKKLNKSWGNSIFPFLPLTLEFKTGAIKSSILQLLLCYISQTLRTSTSDNKQLIHFSLLRQNLSSSLHHLHSRHSSRSSDLFFPPWLSLGAAFLSCTYFTHKCQNIPTYCNFLITTSKPHLFSTPTFCLCPSVPTPPGYRCAGFFLKPKSCWLQKTNTYIKASYVFLLLPLSHPLHPSLSGLPPCLDRIIKVPRSHVCQTASPPLSPHLTPRTLSSFSPLPEPSSWPAL